MLPVSLTLRARQGIIAVLASLLLGGAASADESSFILQSTTSTANSGLYDYLLPRFRARTGIGPFFGSQGRPNLQDFLALFHRDTPCNHEFHFYTPDLN